MNIIEAYFKHLGENPERIDHLLMWTICTFVAWFILFFYRKEILKGLEGLNQLFEVGEVIAFITIWCFAPALFYVLFFLPIPYPFYALLFVGGVFAVTLYGRYIFDWALAFKSGASSVIASKEDK